MRSPERIEFLSDIITAAIEGGIGYWSECVSYSWQDSPPTAVINEIEPHDEDLGELFITIDTIAHGLSVMKQKYPEFYKVGMRDADLENDAGEIDATLADDIVQCGLFEELIYG